MRLGFTAEAGKYCSVSLGQGQEPIAMAALTGAHMSGGWVLLQNIHLTIEWTAGPLEKMVDKLAEGAHPDFRRARAGTGPRPWAPGASHTTGQHGACGSQRMGASQTRAARTS